jgi:curli production assembly/transport component CsgF
MLKVNKTTTRILRRTALGLLAAIWGLGACAEELIYVPVNPAFGGSPLNGNWLLNSAQAQDTFEDPDAKSEDLAAQSELDQFNETLERLALSRIASQLVESFLDGDASFLETQNFVIEAVTDPVTGETVITTTDKATGATSTFVLGPSQ